MSSHEKNIYATTSFDENTLELEFQTDLSYYVDLRQSKLAVKLKFVKRHGYDTYTLEETRKEHKAEESTTTEANDESTDDEITQSKAFVTYVDKIMHSFSQMLMYTSSTIKGAISTDSKFTNRMFQTSSREESLNKEEFCLANGYDIHY